MVPPPKAGLPAVRTLPMAPGDEPPFRSNALNSRTVGVDEIRAYGNRVRSRRRKHLEKLARSIDEFGQLIPVLVDENFEIVDGHFVWQALKSLGRRDVWVVIIAGRSEAETRAIRLALNRLPDDAGWDNHALRIEFESLLELGFDLDLTGFAPVEIDHVLEIDSPKSNRVDGNDIPAAVPFTVTRRGDIWICASHRVGCGDPNDAEFIARLLRGARADMCTVSPFFELPAGASASGKGSRCHRECVERFAGMSEGEVAIFLQGALRLLVDNSSPSAPLYVFIERAYLFELLSAGRCCGASLLDLCVWVKASAGRGSFYRSQHELVAVLQAGADAHLGSVVPSDRDRNRSNVWSYPEPNSLGEEQDAALAFHPTNKPVLMVADAIRDCTKRGNIVVDTFLGAGTALIAAEETGRMFVGSDSNAAHVDLSVRRWQAQTRRDAINEVTGEPFDVMAERANPFNQGLRNG